MAQDKRKAAGDWVAKQIPRFSLLLLILSAIRYALTGFGSNGFFVAVFGLAFALGFLDSRLRRVNELRKAQRLDRPASSKRLSDRSTQDNRSK